MKNIQLTRLCYCRKFFSAPGAAKPPPQQTKLSFATKATGKVEKKAEPVEDEDETPEVKKEVVTEKKAKEQSPEDASDKEKDEPSSGGGMLDLGLRRRKWLTDRDRDQETHKDYGSHGEEIHQACQRKGKA